MQDEEAIQRAVAQGFRTICICRGVRQRTIEVAISKGATTLPEIRRKTMAMTGPCGAKRCTGPIQGILRTVLDAQAAGPTPAPQAAAAPPEPLPAPSSEPSAAPSVERAPSAAPDAPRRKRRRRRRRGGGSGGPPPQP